MVGTSAPTKRLLDALDGAGAPAPAKKPRVAKRKAAAANLGNCSLTKKEFGDRIKSCLALEKYEVQPMRFSLTMDCTFMRTFFGGNANITPPEFDESTPVVVAELKNSQAGAVFGVSKVKNGNRMVTIDLRCMVIVFYPPTGKASCWVSV